MLNLKKKPISLLVANVVDIATHTQGGQSNNVQQPFCCVPPMRAEKGKSPAGWSNDRLLFAEILVVSISSISTISTTISATWINDQHWPTTGAITGETSPEIVCGDEEQEATQTKDSSRPAISHYQNTRVNQTPPSASQSHSVTRPILAVSTTSLPSSPPMALVSSSSFSCQSTFPSPSSLFRRQQLFRPAALVFSRSTNASST